MGGLEYFFSAVIVESTSKIRPTTATASGSSVWLMFLMMSFVYTLSNGLIRIYKEATMD